MAPLLNKERLNLINTKDMKNYFKYAFRDCARCNGHPHCADHS